MGDIYKADMRKLDKKKIKEIGTKIGKLLPPVMVGISKLNEEYKKTNPLEFSEVVTSFLSFIIKEITPKGEQLCISIAYQIMKEASSTITTDEAIEKIKEKKPSYVG